MSSASIMVAIHNKEREIQECRLLISKLEVKVEDQKEAVGVFDSHSVEYEDKIGVKRR